MKSLFYPVLIVALLASCAPRPLPASGGTPGPPALVVEIVLEHMASADAWQVSYRFSEPVRAVRFKHAHYPFRLSNWKTSDGDVRLLRDGSGDLISSKDGGDFRQARVSIPGYDRRPEKEGPLLQPFADGSWLVFTGYLEVEPLDPGHRPVETTFTFVPRAGERVVILGSVSDGPTSWRSVGEGTNVYFGRTTPVVTPDLTLVVDAGAPAWLVERTRMLFPRLFALYAARTGQRLDFKPVVFLSYGSLPDPGSRSIGGGTLPGLVHLDIKLGSRFQDPTQGTLVQDVTYLLAHEAAHFWNGQLFRPHNERSSEWMHEGGADAFAFRAMLELGTLTREQYLARLSDALSGCMLGLAEVTLRQTSGPGRTKNGYNCGSTIALLTETALRKQHAGPDIFRFWGKLFASSRARLYDEATYLDTLRGEAGGEAAALIERMLNRPDGGSALLTTLHSLGVVTAVDESTVTPAYRQLAGKLACHALVRGDCGEGTMVNEAGDRCTVDPASRCQSLQAGSSLVAVGPHALFRDGPAAYDYVSGQCAAGGRLAVEMAGSGTVETACSRPPPARPAYRRIRSLPFP